MVWIIKYAPKNLKEFVNQKEGLQKFLSWYKSYKPGKKAALIYGPPGIGKTALVRAFAREKNLDLIEMNASDFRTAEKIREVFGHSIAQASLFRRGKIFLIDEVDGISGKEDRGGLAEIIKIIKESKFPIVLTANDAWDPKLKALRNYCELIQFKPLGIRDIVKRLEYICAKEGIKTDIEVLKQIAQRSKGDLRAAINDLETVSRGKKSISLKDLEVLGFREREEEIFEVLKTIFKSKSLRAPKFAIMNADRDPDEIFWWIEENISNEYERIEEIAKAYEFLSKADLFRRRIISRQYWRLIVYMIDLMGPAIALSKKEMYRKFTKYRSPLRLKLLGQLKPLKQEVNQALEKLSEELHCSKKVIKKEFIPLLKFLSKNPSYKQAILNHLKISEESLNQLISI